LIELAESHLRRLAVPADEWPGMKFRFGENIVDGMWASVVLEIERRGEQWIVTRLDRSRDRLEDGELGLRRVA